MPSPEELICTDLISQKDADQSVIMISKNNKYMFGLEYIYMLSAGQILPTCNATHATARHRNASRPRPSHTSNMILPGTDRSAVELW